MASEELEVDKLEVGIEICNELCKRTDHSRTARPCIISTSRGQ